ncbi:lipoprotein [Lacinutrix sp. C3R15]|uniref:lipoprotein n=1 Tax=Flavobacteriaceae TaxID=49546 RepID=UPI001C083636|nr:MULTISPECIES: lipoprotein [Flavobacteriaceae]MBU2939702.1 lipoprotein [Lacinutrix sp. C3R15]MDO6623017.1 lipoprotein [Oceanihabitans sp. 1_MG-2023]
MKQILLVLVSVFLLTSCNFTEEITFNPDGSGEFVMRYDMSEIMKTMDEMGGAKKDDTKEKVKLDSVMYFKDMLVEKADSIAKLPVEEQEKLKSLESIIIKMKMDEEEGLFDIGFGSTFTSLEELPEALEKIDEAKKLNSENNSQFGQLGESAVTKASEDVFEYIDFTYDGKTFSRFVKKDFELATEDIESLDAEINEMGESKEVFEAMSYTLVYHFPKEIESVTNKNAVISADKKSVSLKMNFIEMIKSPEAMTLDVELKD